MLEVHLCKPGRYKLKILGRGNLNIINQQGEPQKGTGKQNGGGGQGHNFDLNLVGGGGGGILEETMFQQKCFYY